MASKKKELLEPEIPADTGTENAESVNTAVPDNPGHTPPSDTSPDLNELLCGMEQPVDDSTSMEESLPVEAVPDGTEIPEDRADDAVVEILDEESDQADNLTVSEAISEDGSPTDSISEDTPAPAKPRRTRKKKADAAEAAASPDDDTPTDNCDIPEEPVPSGAAGKEDILAKEETTEDFSTLDEIPLQGESLTDSPVPPVPHETSRRMTAPVLTIRSREDVETAEDRADIIWHEIHNAYRTRRILTGQLGGIEQLDNHKTVAIVDYKGFRILVPLKEMMINLGRSPSGQAFADLMQRQNKILGNMLGADIDFVVRGIDSKTRSVVASRREAMMRKRQVFYLDLDAQGMYRVYDGRIVQARVIAVADKVIRVEVFGVECSILARDLAWDWIGDAHERFSVGDEVLVRVLSVQRNSLEDISIRADIKSISENTDRDNLKKCRIQGKYAGKVTDVHKGVVYVRLANGVNAVAHSCYDYRMPGKKDDVSFAVTRLDVERGVAVGIITRIIRQNL